MLLNLASDKPFVYENGNFIFFDRKNLETELPDFFYKQQFLSQLYVITGPGYFSSTRIGTEVVNILSFLGKIEKLYFLDKISLYQQYMKANNLVEVYLFSGNKSLFILVTQNGYSIQKQCKGLSEEFFSKNLPECNYIPYKKLLADYRNFIWDESKYIRPYYVFKPIVS